MWRRSLIALAIAGQCLAQISSVIYTPSATTITATWTSASSGSTGIECSAASGGPYTLTGLEDSSASVTSHHDIVVSLAASTAYYCELTTSATTTAQQAVTTTAVISSTPITGARIINTTGTDGFNGYVLGTHYNSAWPTHYSDGDTYFNTVCGNGVNYSTKDDGHNFDGAVTGTAYTNASTTPSALSINSWSGTPLVGTTVNQMSSFGNYLYNWKAFGLYCPTDFYNLNTLYMTSSWQTQTSSGDHVGSNINRSNDLGLTWSNWQAPGSFSSTGAVPSSSTANFFGGTNNPISGSTFSPYSVITPVGYLPGNADSNPLVDQQNAYIYSVACGVDAAVDDSYFANGDKAFLLRVPRFVFGNMSGADWQWYTGSGADGTLNSSWSSASGGATPILAVTGYTGWCSMQWLPNLNRYLLITTSYQAGKTDTADTEWRYYEMAHPWSTPTEVFRSDFYPGGWFGSIPLASAVPNFTAANVLRVLATGDYGTAGTPLTTQLYSPYYVDVQIETGATKPLNYSYGSTPNAIPTKGALAIYDFPNSGPTLPDRSGNGQNVTLSNSQRWTQTGGFFWSGSNYSLPFGTDYPNGVGLGNFTVAVVWKANAGSFLANEVLLGKLNSAGNAIDFAITRSGSTANSMGISLLGTTAFSSSFNDAGWNLIIVERNATTGLIQVFRNGLGTADASATAAAGALNTTSLLHLGNSTLSPDDACDCMMPVVGVWDRLLTPYEMQAIHASAQSTLASRGIALP